MRFASLMALYGGPDQVMTVTSGLASVLGLLLLFWNKVVGFSSRWCECSAAPTRLLLRNLPRTLRKVLYNSRVRSCAKKSLSSDWTGLSPVLWKRCWNAENSPISQRFGRPAVTPA